MHCDEYEDKESKEAHGTSIFFKKKKLLYINRTILAIILFNFQINYVCY